MVHTTQTAYIMTGFLATGVHSHAHTHTHTQINKQRFTGIGHGVEWFGGGISKSVWTVGTILASSVT